jgi:hypothetical protein
MGWAIDRSFRLSQSTVKMMGQEDKGERIKDKSNRIFILLCYLFLVLCECGFVNCLIDTKHSIVGPMTPLLLIKRK